ncbi:laminin subunit alpha-3 isoform X1 [Pseudonaja textilis]|uniref:laminin subunit alpha-3 isoform X1 n=1 Tax=Pseudonaja textilis TaxID=8673 RepID=UPI000EAA0E49|nr:laminin subunit alpha-3 isoform X1 [Pseudonaja textilis]
MARTRVAAVLLTSRTPPGAALAGIVLALWSCCHPAGSLSASSLGAGERARSLHPPYFNLAETTRIWATATCGQDKSGRPRLELFCKLVGGPAASPAGQTIQGQFCDYCNAADPNKAHPIDYAIDGTERWWQSPSLSLGLKYDEINVTLDLGQLFHVAYVLIKFANSPRPDLWVLEKSIDFGRTYTPWQYFAYSKADCWEHFRKEANSPLRKDNDVICTTEYSRIVPLENGEIVISLVNGRPGANTFSHSSILREFTKATNIRLHFLRTNTLLGHLISKAQRDPTVTRRYYYSLKDISIGGQCVCHGHADVCAGKTEPDSYRYQCECQHNTCGETCDRCCPGYNQKSWQPATASSTNACEPCNCHGHALDCYYDHDVERRKESLNLHGQYQGGGVCIDCQHNTAGINCEKCLKGYYRPYGVPITAVHGCIPCWCSPEHSNGCEEGSGRCYCQLNYQGETCDRCADGYHNFPFCYRIPISPATTQNPAVPSPGHIDGNRCRPGDFGTHCQPCQCSTYGSYQDTCHPTSGQCDCRHGFIGKQCDRCVSKSSTFPHCQGVIDECDPAGTRDSYSGYCQCLQNVEGPTCSICKPLYWNLDSANPYGCIDCQCNVAGVLSGIRECQQLAGECYCKPNVCGGPCDTCEAGYHGLETKNYFGCQGCKCDVGGSVSHVCNDLTGDCQCRSHIIGKTCTEPEKNYYFPDLHHMKSEIEDGTSPNGRGVRFGYNSQEFPGFSWRGYVQMSSIQNEVRITLSVKKPKPYLFHVILRYINPGTAIISGHITAYQSRTLKGTDQSKDIFFPHSREPAFVTVPGKGFADSFLLGPGTWMFKIMAEGVLLDYLVLLPSDYYEASILQFPVVHPCIYSGYIKTDNCLQYEYLPVDKYRCVFGTEVTFFLHRGEYRKTTFQQPTVKHPVMSHISGQEVNLQIKLKVPQVGRYVILFEYVTVYDLMYVSNVKTESLGQVMEAKINIYSCKYSFLCRSVVIDDMARIAVFDLLADTTLHLRSSALDFLLHKICIIPIEDFSLDYVEPQVYCIATYIHGSSASCIPLQYEKPLEAVVLDARRDSKVVEGSRYVVSTDSLSSPLLSLHSANGVILSSSRNQIILNGRVPHIGRYVFIIHFYQPENPTFSVQILVDGGQLWSGSYNASFCPHISGCRSLLMSENHIEFDILKHDISVTMKIPNERTMVLEYILVVPAHSYNYTLLHKDSVIRSTDFISQCGGNSFHIVPGNSSEFCRNSARSLVAAFNDGALPCNCHRKGATSAACNPDGGQCNCRAYIIGRQCTRCQTGYYGFPFCKPCSCGRSLCDDITGKCICPPQTVKPRCEACVRLHFGYHPLIGCEKCNCSSKGVIRAMNPECNKIDGQCRCRSGIAGRQCDHCAPGSYGFPNCKPCKCNRGGTERDICNPQTGVCLCKENVEGVQCDMCRSGSFYLNPANPKGCTTCFCFGATNICHSANKHRVKFTDMRNWHLEAVGNAMSIPTTFNPISNSVVADVQELPPFLHNLYWVAPSSYLGNKLSSYGGYLSYQLKSFGLPSEGMALLEKRPDVQIIGREMKITYIDPNNPLPDKLYYGSVQLVEENFRHTSSNNLVSREELMMVLSRLDGLQIRGLYFTETQRLTLGNVGLEEATNTGNGNIAYAVEACSCPPEYMGDSCQECSPGFYRESVGQFTGKCVPCSCNGNSDSCLDGSGICINCQHNTAGEKCERCKEGYFRDASQGLCKECHCPYTNSFASGCLEVNGEIQCFCKEGYSGKHCESCAPGYFGNPLKYRYCQKCNCLENGQLTKCDRLTGECISQEPKDIDPNEDCNSCESCVITLLEDLSTMGSELRVIEFQIQSINTSAQLLGQMKHLEVRSKQLESLLDHSRSVVKTQRSKVDELETGLSHLNQNINALKEKAEGNYKKAQTLLNNFSKTNQRGRALISKIQSILIHINVLLGQIDGTSTEGNSLPIKHSAKELMQAQQMINEMRNRNFGQQLTEAEKEKGKAQHLLDRIRNELEKRKANNQGLIKSVRDSLNEYESKLNDLHESLREAKEQIKLAENLNGENKRLLEDIEKQTEEVTRQQSAIRDLLNSAKASVSQTNSIFELFQKSKEEYESLAANLDEAKKDLDEKLKSQFLSSSKEPLVVKAEMYANSLQDLARKLDELKKNASKNELVTCFMEGATTFENISDIIRAAEAAANKALSAADSATSIVDEKDLPGMAERLKTNSGKVLNKARETQKTLQDLNPALDVMRNKLQEAEQKKTAIQENLSEFQNNLQGIKRDKTESLITSANTMIKNANNITTNVLSELDPIKAGVENIKNTYENIQITDFNKALREASHSVNNLTSMLPDLFNKITNINQQVISTGNITENINRIRELIQKARDAANKVAIPMKFNGKSGVEVRLPDILDDLKGYTSLSFFLQRPDKKEHMTQPQTRNMFVMYLGNKDSSSNYIGMAIRGGHLICAYNLGGSENEIRVMEKLYEKNTRDITLDQVSFKRIYQYAELEYKHAASSDLSSKYVPQDSSRNSNTLLNLDPDKVVFYVGGYPPEFTPPSVLDYPHYEGCVELDSLNDRVFSLYNFKRTFNLNTTVVQPCRRYREQSDEFYFEGIGYAHIKVSSDLANIRYEQTIQTTSDVGLVFFAENQDKFISLRIENGSPIFTYKVDSQPPREILNGSMNNVAENPDVILHISPKQYIFGVDKLRLYAIVKTFHFKSYYLGGIPTSLRERFNISTPPFRGCMKNIKTSFERSISFSDSFGVSRKCPDDWKLMRTANFFKNGVLDLSDQDFPFPDNFQVGFGFHTLAVNGMLLSYNIRLADFTVFLRNGYVIVSLADEEIQSSKKCEIGSMHYITVIKEDDTLKLLFDDMPNSKTVVTPERNSMNRPIKLGGNNFEGCMSNIFIERSQSPAQVQNLTDSVRTNVSLGFCMIPERQKPMLLKELPDRHHPKISKKRKNIGYLTDSNRQQNKNDCPLHVELNFVPEAYHFGNNPGTYLLFSVSQTSTDRSHFAVDVRTSSSRGMVFFMGDQMGNRYVALYLSKGRYVLAVAYDGKKIKIKSKAKYSDGQWHMVAFSMSEKKIRLVIDGLKTREENLPSSYPYSQINTSIYLGAVPPLNIQNIPKKSFVGCLRNFQVGRKHMYTYQKSNGVLPCLDNILENGVSFFNEGGYIVIENTFLINIEYRIAFSIRPRSFTGILIHAGSNQQNYLTLYMKGGMLTASGNNGAGEFSLSVTLQQSLCDGQWHSVAVSQKQNIIYLDVDTNRNYTAALSPKLSTSHAQPLYFGRVPVNLETPWLPIQDVFLGCLKNMKINDKSILLNKMSNIHGVVSLEGCPAY